MEVKFAILEDALGETVYIDTGFVTDWTSFHRILSRSFQTRPGYDRVARGRYRIADQDHANNLVDPTLPHLAFDYLFRPGQCVQMSILFFPEEVRQDECARRGWALVPVFRIENVCSRCNFRYHGQVVDYNRRTKATEVPDDRSVVKSGTSDRGPSLASDLPGCFRRIGIAWQVSLLSVRRAHLKLRENLEIEVLILSLLVSELDPGADDYEEKLTTCEAKRWRFERQIAALDIPVRPLDLDD